MQGRAAEALPRSTGRRGTALRVVAGLCPPVPVRRSWCTLHSIVFPAARLVRVGAAGHG